MRTSSYTIVEELDALFDGHLDAPCVQDLLRMFKRYAGHRADGAPDAGSLAHAWTRLEAAAHALID